MKLTPVSWLRLSLMFLYYRWYDCTKKVRILLPFGVGALYTRHHLTPAVQGLVSLLHYQGRSWQVIHPDRVYRCLRFIGFPFYCNVSEETSTDAFEVFLFDITISMKINFTTLKQDVKDAVLVLYSPSIDKNITSVTKSWSLCHNIPWFQSRWSYRRGRS